MLPSHYVKKKPRLGALAGGEPDTTGNSSTTA